MSAHLEGQVALLCFLGREGGPHAHGGRHGIIDWQWSVPVRAHQVVKRHWILTESLLAREFWLDWSIIGSGRRTESSWSWLNVRVVWLIGHHRKAISSVNTEGHGRGGHLFLLNRESEFFLISTQLWNIHLLTYLITVGGITRLKVKESALWFSKHWTAFLLRLLFNLFSL